MRVEWGCVHVRGVSVCGGDKASIAQAGYVSSVWRVKVGWCRAGHTRCCMGSDNMCAYSSPSGPKRLCAVWTTLCACVCVCVSKEADSHPLLAFCFCLAVFSSSYLYLLNATRRTTGGSAPSLIMTTSTCNDGCVRVCVHAQRARNVRHGLV